MGIYYMIACDELKERIDPGHINNLGIKAHAIAHPKHPLGSVVIFALLYRWRGKVIRLANDAGNDAGYDDYKDVTNEVIDEYNTEYMGSVFTPLTFTEDEEDNKDDEDY